MHLPAQGLARRERSGDYLSTLRRAESVARSITARSPLGWQVHGAGGCCLRAPELKATKRTGLSGPNAARIIPRAARDGQRRGDWWREKCALRTARRRGRGLPLARWPGPVTNERAYSASCAGDELCSWCFMAEAVSASRFHRFPPISGRGWRSAARSDRLQIARPADAAHGAGKGHQSAAAEAKGAAIFAPGLA